MSKLDDFKEYVQEQQQLSDGIDQSISKQYDFILEVLQSYQELEQAKADKLPPAILEDRVMIDFSKPNKKELSVWVDTDKDIILEVDEEVAILSIKQARELGNTLLDKSIEALDYH